MVESMDRRKVRIRRLPRVRAGECGTDMDTAAAHAREGASAILLRSTNISARMGVFLLDKERLANSDVDLILSAALSFFVPIMCGSLLEKLCRILLLNEGSTLSLRRFILDMEATR